MQKLFLLSWWMWKKAFCSCIFLHSEVRTSKRGKNKQSTFFKWSHCMKPVEETTFFVQPIEKFVWHLNICKAYLHISKAVKLWKEKSHKAYLSVNMGLYACDTSIVFKIAEWSHSFFVVASWNHGGISRQGLSCLKCQPMSHWDYRLDMKPASCAVAVQDGSNSTMFSFWSRDKTPPRENISVAHKSDPAFLCLACLWKQDKISLNSALFSLDESESLLPSFSLRPWSAVHLYKSTRLFSLRGGPKENQLQHPILSTRFQTRVLLPAFLSWLPSRWAKCGGCKQDRGFNKRWCCLVWFWEDGSLPWGHGQVHSAAPPQWTGARGWQT